MSTTILVNESGPKITRKMEEAITILMNGGRAADIARECNVGESTARRWMHLPAFKERYRRERRAVFERAVSFAQRASTTAVRVAVDIMRDEEEAAFARLSAAKIILDLARETDVEQRLTALEEQMESEPKSYESSNAIN